MPKVRRLFFVFIVLIEIFLITILGFYIKTKNTPKKSVYILKSNDFVFNSDSKPKYFYEPKSDTKEEVRRWAPEWAIPSTLKTNGLYYTINSDSLNERFNYSVEKPKNTYRIITLGDSFTFSVFVNTKDGWPEKLEDNINKNFKCKNVNKFEVINLGVPGYDIDYSVERFRIRGSKYKPDLVIWLLKKDDFTEIGEIFRQDLSNFEKSINKKSIGLLGNKETIIKNSTDIIDNGTINKLGENETLKKQYEILKKINNYYLGKLLIFTFPLTDNKYKTIIKKFSYGRNNTFFYDEITNIYNNNNLYLPDKHPSKEGYKIIADDLFNYLTKNKIIPCNK